MRSILGWMFVVVSAVGCGHRSKGAVDAGADAAAVPADTARDLAPDAAPDVSAPDVSAPDVSADAEAPALDVAPDAPPPKEAGIAGVATLIGQSNHAGTTVRVEGQAASATTEADGAFLLPPLPAGDY